MGAAAVENYENIHFDLIGSYKTCSGLNDIFINGDKAFLATSEGVVILDISDPSNPEEKEYFNRENLYKLVEKNNFIFSIDKSSGKLIIIDSNGNEGIKEVGEINLSKAEEYELAIQNDNVYVAFNDQILILDVTVPTHPKLDHRIDINEMSGVSSIKIIDDLFYITNKKNQFIISNSKGTVLSIYNMTERSEYSSGTSFLTIEDKIAYVSSNNNLNIEAIDISDPYNPRKINVFKMDYYFQPDLRNNPQFIEYLSFYSHSVKEKVVFAAYTKQKRDYFPFIELVESGIVAIDFHDHINPNIIGKYPYLENGNKITIVDNKAFVLDQSKGLYIFNISHKNNKISSNGSDTEIIDIWGEKNESDSIKSIAKDMDIDLNHISTFKTDDMGDLFIENGVAYITTPEKLILLDIIESNNIKQLSVFKLEEEKVTKNELNIGDREKTQKLLVLNKTLYLIHNADYNPPKFKLTILDVSDPINIVKLSTYNLSDFDPPFEMHVLEDQVFITNSFHEKRLDVINTKDKKNPEKVGEFFFKTYIVGNEVKASNGIIYLGAGSGNFLILNGKIPSDIKKISQCELLESSYVILIKNFAYTFDKNRLFIINISDPERPYIVKMEIFLDHSEYVKSYSVENNTLSILYEKMWRSEDYQVSSSGVTGTYTSEKNGLAVLDITIPEKPVLLGKYLMPRSTDDIFVSNNRIYALDNEQGLMIYETEIKEKTLEPIKEINKTLNLIYVFILISSLIIIYHRFDKIYNYFKKLQKNQKPYHQEFSETSNDNAKDKYISAKQKNINPFVLPSVTNILFILLIFSILISTLQFLPISNIKSLMDDFSKQSTTKYYQDTSDITDASLQKNTQFLESVISYPTSGYLSDNNMKYPYYNIIKTIHFIFSILLFPLIIVFAWWLYITKSKRYIDKHGLEDLNKVYPDVSLKIYELIRSVKLEQPVTILYENTDEIDIHTFGKHDSLYLVLSDGFIKKFKNKNEEFEAIIYHELGHFVNKDVSITEFTFSLIYSFYFVMLVFTPFFLYMKTEIYKGQLLQEIIFDKHVILNTGISIYFPSIFSIIVITAIAQFLLISSLLRIREIYADAQCAIFQKNTDHILKALNRLEIIAKMNTARGKLGFISFSKGIKKFFSFHPSVSVRKSYLKNPQNIFYMNGFIVFITGMLVYLTSYRFFKVVYLNLLSIDNYPQSNVGLDKILNSIPEINVMNFTITIALGYILLVTMFLTYTFASGQTNRFGIRIKSLFYGLFYIQIFISGYLIFQVLFDILFSGKLIIDIGRYQYNYILGIEFSDTFFLPTLNLVKQKIIKSMISSELLALIIFISLLLSQWIQIKLLNCYNLILLNKYPKISYLVVPGVISILPAAVILTVIQPGLFSEYYSEFILYYFVPSYVFLVILISIFEKKTNNCPSCGNTMKDAFNPFLQCPKCNNEIGSWLLQN